MFNLFLTQGGGFLGPLERLLGWILNWIYVFLANFGIESVALTIIFFTLIVKTLMLPITIRQQRFSKMSSIMNPEITAIQEKYKDKKDEVSMQRMQNETQAVYDKYGTNQVAGCLPMLITFPIIISLYQVIQKIPAYIKPIKEWYTVIADGLRPLEGSAAKLMEYGGELGVKVSEFAEYASEGILTSDHAIDILSKFKVETWNQLATVDFPSIADLINQNASEIIRVNSMPGGLNMLEAPGFAFPGIIIPILAALLQFVQSRQMASPDVDSSNTTATTMNSMNRIMPIMSGVFCTMLPTGVGLYWVSNSLFTIIQNLFINRSLKTADIDKMIEKNKEKQKKKEKEIGINKGASFEQIAKMSTRKIDDSNIYKTQEKQLDSKSQNSNSLSNDKNEKDNSSSQAGSISDYANILRNRNNDK